MSKGKDKEVREDIHRQIVPNVTDPDMFMWLESLFELSPRDTAPVEGRAVPKSEPDSFPDRIELRAVFGARGQDRSEPLKNKEWKATSSPVPSRETLVQLANEFVAAAQKETNVKQKKQRYGLFALSSLKGAHPYEQFPFVCLPTGKEYGPSSGLVAPASDDDDTHRDRFMQMMLAHTRWNHEQTNETISGVLKLQQEIIRTQNEQISIQNAERRALILAAEEALSKKEERETAREWAKFKQQTIEEGIMMLKGIMPAVQVYLTKGKSGIAEGLKAFVQSLSQEQEVKLLGVWEGGECRQLGVLRQDQLQVLTGIMNGSVEPKSIVSMISSFTQDQMAAAQTILDGSQIAALMALARAASDTTSGS